MSTLSDLQVLAEISSEIPLLTLIFVLMFLMQYVTHKNHIFERGMWRENEKILRESTDKKIMYLIETIVGIKKR